MNLRQFFVSIGAIVFSSWKTILGKLLEIEVFPNHPDDLPGLIVANPLTKERYTIIREYEQSDNHIGRILANHRRNFFWGKSQVNPEEQLLFIDHFDLEEKRYKFYRVI